MSRQIILAIDQGTTNTKALLVERSGRVTHRVSAPVELLTQEDGRVEQNPEELWTSVRATAEAAARHARESGAAIEAIALTNQRETALAWHAQTTETLANAVSWQCIRSAGICERLNASSEHLRGLAGLPLAPLISASKWAWLLENSAAVDEAAKNGTLRLGTVDTWLTAKMTGGTTHATDLTNASRTGLLDLGSCRWSEELCASFGIPAGSLAELRPSSGDFGVCETIDGLKGVPILAAIGDSHGAMFGHGKFGAGAVKSTYGTGSSLMALTAGLADDTPALARTIAWAFKDGVQYALEGNIAMTGSAVQWLGEFLRLAKPAQAMAELAESVADSAGVYFVPAMVGLGAPWWDAAARGTITGLGRHHTAAHLAEACVESIAFQVADVFFAMEQSAGLRFKDLMADGGATRNARLMQFQADILARPVERSKNEELSAIGAAWLAGIELGWWNSLGELEELAEDGDHFEPRMDEPERVKLHSGWVRAVAKARSSTGTQC